jgi:hypothetical protein
VDPGKGPRWAKYFKDCRESKRKPSQWPDWVPQVLPGNEDIIHAFNLVRNCRHVGMAAGGFDWQGVKVKLELHGMWNREIERGLDVCEYAMIRAENRSREREQATTRPPAVKRK